MGYELNTAAAQLNGREQFLAQTGGADGPCLVTIGLVRKPILMARLACLGFKKMRRATNERQHAVDCALRAITHFNPQHGYCAETECVRCKCIITDSDNISIVALALPPWSRKSDDPVKTAMMAGFFCAACDISDDEATALWRAAVKEQGVELLSANESKELKQ